MGTAGPENGKDTYPTYFTALPGGGFIADQTPELLAQSFAGQKISVTILLSGYLIPK
jgi:hypothetical protein